MQFECLSISRTSFRNALNFGKSFYRKGPINPLTFRGYRRTAASPFVRPAIKGHLQMARLPSISLPFEIMEAQLGDQPSAELQEKLK